MANILQVTSAPVTPDPSVQHGRVAPDMSVKNPVNPSAVNRADGQETGQTGSSTGEGRFSAVDFEGNYGLFERAHGQCEPSERDGNRTFWGRRCGAKPK